MGRKRDAVTRLIHGKDAEEWTRMQSEARKAFERMVRGTKRHGAMCPCDTCKKVRGA
jgi:hypothetical protein